MDRRDRRTDGRSTVTYRPRCATMRASSVNNYSAAIAGRSTVTTVSVCLSVSISPVIHIRSLPNFCARYLWDGRGSVLFWRRRDTCCTSGFMDDVIHAYKPRQLNVAAQLIEAQPTRSLGLGYKRRVGIPAAGQWTHTHGSTFRAPRSGPTRPQWAC